MSLTFKSPKGTVDHTPDEQFIRDRIIAIVNEAYDKFGVDKIDTPSFELTEVLRAKAGDEKEMYDLVTPGGDDADEREHCSLRFDLTVPFSRYVRQNSIKKIKRGQIGKVYRRDQPNKKTGRLREFIQCDYDILGFSSVSLVNAELIWFLDWVLRRLELPCEYEIRVNSVEVFQRVFSNVGIKSEYYSAVARIIDKLEKKGRVCVQKELLNLLGSQRVIDNLFDILDNLFESQLTSVLGDDHVFTKTLAVARQLVHDGNSVRFDASLSRGLDYYTGMILEVKLRGRGSYCQFGSIAAGGRYDRLCGNDLSCAGVSIGVDRIAQVLGKSKSVVKPKKYACVIVPIGVQTDNWWTLLVLKRLRDLNVPVKFNLNEQVHLGKELRYTLKSEIPYVLFIGPRETETETVTVKTIAENKQENMTFGECLTLLMKHQRLMTDEILPESLMDSIFCVYGGDEK